MRKIPFSSSAPYMFSLERLFLEKSAQLNITLITEICNLHVVVYTDLSSCEQPGHLCKLVQCLQKQEYSPKYIAHYACI